MSKGKKIIENNSFIFILFVVFLTIAYVSAININMYKLNHGYGNEKNETITQESITVLKVTEKIVERPSYIINVHDHKYCLMLSNDMKVYVSKKDYDQYIVDNEYEFIIEETINISTKVKVK